MSESKKRTNSNVSAAATKKPKPGFTLANVMNEIDKTTEELEAGSKILRQDVNRQPAIVERLVKDIGSMKDLRNVEVEIRVGLMSGEGFKSNVQKDDFYAFQKLIGKGRSFTMSEETDYIFEDHERGQNYRISYDEDNKRCIRAIAKRREGNHDMGTNLTYDMRVGIATELELECPLKLPVGHKLKREKVRQTFQDKFWKADLTMVTATAPGQHAETATNEIEFELSPAAIADKAQLPAILDSFITDVRGIIAQIQMPSEHSFPELILQRVHNAEEISALRDMCMSCFPEVDNTADAFPGSMPVGFSRRSIPLIQQTDYYVSEKTDGLRYMMMITGECPYLIDRKFDFYVLQGFPLLVELFGQTGVTLLDGEMVRHAQTKQAMFMIFDIICLNGGPSLISHNLGHRLECIGKAVMAFREGKEKGKIDEKTLPFTLIGKVFKPKTQIGELFRCISPEQGGKRFYTDAKRHHATDGVIFTPNIEYQCYTSQKLFKWKYQDKLTVDFKLRYNKQKWFLACTGSDGYEVDVKEVNFPPQDMAQLTRDVGRTREANSMIIECAFDVNLGVWRYMGVRADKNKPNYITTVFDTMSDIAENITAEELRYRIALTPQTDKWEVEMAKMRQEIASRVPRPPGSSSSSVTRQQQRPTDYRPPPSSHQQQHSHNNPHHNANPHHNSAANHNSNNQPPQQSRSPQPPQQPAHYQPPPTNSSPQQQFYNPSASYNPTEYNPSANYNPANSHHNGNNNEGNHEEVEWESSEQEFVHNDGYDGDDRDEE